MRLRFTSVFLALFALPCAAQPLLDGLKIPETHPRLVLSREDIGRMHKNVRSGREPWKTAWRQLQERLEPCFGPEWSEEVYTGGHSFEFYQAATRDGEYARDLAIAYHVSHEERYARRSLEIIEAWLAPEKPAGTWFDPEIRYPNTGMEVARASFPFLYAYDLLCADDLVPEATRDKFRSWLRLLLPHIHEGARRWADNDYFGEQYYQNHIAADAMGLMAIGVILRDEELVRYAVDSPDNPRDAAEVVEGVILMRGQPPYRNEPVIVPPQDGEIVDRYRHFSMGGHYKDYRTLHNRGLVYCGLTSVILTAYGEMGRLNGMDFYGWTAPTGETIRLPLLYYADFYIGKNTVIKSGFYAGEDDWINASDTATSALWEIARCRFPGEKKFRQVLRANERGGMMLHLFGPVTLTHGR